MRRFAAGKRVAVVAGATTKLDRPGGVSSAGRAPALQAGGHRFDPGTLHHKKYLICRTFVRRASKSGNSGASAVRADLSIRVRWSRVRSGEVELSTRVGRRRITNRPCRPEIAGRVATLRPLTFMWPRVTLSSESVIGGARASTRRRSGLKTALSNPKGRTGASDSTAPFCPPAQRSRFDAA